MYEMMQLNYPMNRSLAGGAFFTMTVLQQVAVHACGYQRVIVRDCGICIGTLLTGAPNIDFYLRTKPGDNTTKVFKFNWAPTVLTAGTVHIKRGVNVLIEPGQDFVAEVTVVSGGAGAAGIYLYIEPFPEQIRKYTNVKRAIQ